MKEENNKLPVHYCSYCGQKIIPSMVYANENKMYYGDLQSIPFASKYNNETGEKQYCPFFECPDYKQKKWYQIGGSPHDKYFLDEIWVEKKFGVWEKVDN